MSGLRERLQALDPTARRLLMAYLASTACWLLAVAAYARVGRVVVGVLGLTMWVAGAVTAALIPEQAGHVAARTRYLVGAYGLMLLLYRLAVQLFGALGPEDWGTALGAGIPVPLGHAAAGWLYTLVLVLMIGVPAAYIAWIAQLYMVYRGRRRIEEALRQYQRRF